MMAKKFPPPDQKSGGGKDQDRGGGGGQGQRTREQQEEDPSSASSSVSSSTHPGGARPRNGTTNTTRTEDLQEARRQQIRNGRRRLDSLNLEMGNGSLESVDGLATSPFYGWIPDFSSPYYGGGGGHSRIDTLNEGRELYLHFFHEQLRSEGIDEAEVCEDRLGDYHLPSAHLQSPEHTPTRTRRRRPSMNLSNFQNPIWRQHGRDLRILAEQFANSRERQLVRMRAERVDVGSLDYDQFMTLLKELFEGGQITRERILVLFFFCSDLAILAVRCKLNGLMARLTQWTLVFIRDQVCDWVHQHGGWPSVLRTGLNIVQQACIIGMCAAVMTACFFYVRKNIK